MFVVDFLGLWNGGPDVVRKSDGHELPAFGTTFE